MWWNDILEVKESMAKVIDRISHLERAFLQFANKAHPESDVDKKMEELKECVSDFLFSEDAYSPINRVHDKLDSLLRNEDKLRAVALADKTLDKFEDYMKNVDKLNGLVNEFKGCICLARGALEERKKVSESESETVKLMLKIAELLRKQEKKSPKKRKKTKKSADSQS